jgi:hypothetical protein
MRTLPNSATLTTNQPRVRTVGEGAESVNYLGCIADAPMPERP